MTRSCPPAGGDKPCRQATTSHSRKLRSVVLRPGAWCVASDELSLFSYEVLSLVGNSGAGAHDLARMVQRGRALAWAGESQYYVEPKRLARLGYLVARKEPGKTRERTVYE